VCALQHVCCSVLQCVAGGVCTLHKGVGCRAVASR